MVPSARTTGNCSSDATGPWLSWKLRPEVSVRRVDAARDGAVLFGRRDGQPFIHCGQREAGAHDEVVAERPGQADARLEVVPILLVERLGVSDHADAAGDDVIRAGGIEAGHLAVLVVLGALHLVTDAQVQGEVRRDFPIVLEIPGVNPVARQVAEQVRVMV